MSSYIFGSVPSKCQAAQDLVRQYSKNREAFIQKVIKIAASATESHISEVALGMGKTELRVDVETVVKKNEEIKKLQEELKLKKFKLINDERKLVVQALVHHFEDAGFKVKSNNHNVVDISWKE